MSGKVEAAGHLLAAEAYYLREAGWIPLSPAVHGGAVRWRTVRGSSVSQEEALREQKAKDNWPEVRP